VAFVTDNGNYIYDCAFKEIIDPELLDEALRMVPGVVENGLFLGLADVAFVAGPKGLEVIEADSLEDDA
jgi:ribose 5-phosphate isomerase A